MCAPLLFPPPVPTHGLRTSDARATHRTQWTPKDPPSRCGAFDWGDKTSPAAEKEREKEREIGNFYPPSHPHLVFPPPPPPIRAQNVCHHENTHAEPADDGQDARRAKAAAGEAAADLDSSLTEMDWVVSFSSAFSHDCMLSPVRPAEKPAAPASVISRGDLATMMRIPPHVRQSRASERERERPAWEKATTPHGLKISFGLARSLFMLCALGDCAIALFLYSASFD